MFSLLSGTHLGVEWLSHMVAPLTFSEREPKKVTYGPGPSSLLGSSMALW